VLIRR
jgi:hypothetical protein